MTVDMNYDNHNKRIIHLESEVSRILHEMNIILSELLVAQNELISARTIINHSVAIYNRPSKVSAFLPLAEKLCNDDRSMHFNTRNSILNTISYDSIIIPIEAKYNRRLRKFRRRMIESDHCRRYNPNLTLTQNVDCDHEEAIETFELFFEFHHFLDITANLPMDHFDFV